MINTYLQYGVSSDLANKLNSLGIPKTTFENTSNKNLVSKYNLKIEEIILVKELIKRKPIENDIIEQLLENSNFTCCICKGVKGKSYIIHHIEEYSINQNNGYHNLAVLCPNDHDLAHKKGKSLTSTLTEEQIITQKHKWQLEVQRINIEKASISGNIFEVDFLNVPRILELCIEIFGGIPDTAYTQNLINSDLIESDGNLNEVKISTFAKNPNTPLIFFAPLGSAMLRTHYYEIFKALIAHLNFKDLDLLLNKTSIKTGIIGEYCYYVGGLYSSPLSEHIDKNSEEMKFHLSKKKTKVEWLVDPKYFASSSAKWRTANRTNYMIYGKIRNVRVEVIDGEKIIVIDIRPYCFGLPELTKHRTPDIAYRDEIDEILGDEN
jgi:hypothetical protein